MSDNDHVINSKQQRQQQQLSTNVVNTNNNNQEKNGQQRSTPHFKSSSNVLMNSRKDKSVVFIACSKLTNALNNITVRELLDYKLHHQTRPLIMLNVDHTISDALRLFSENHIISAPVLERENPMGDKDGEGGYRLKGVIDVLDIVLFYISISKRHKTSSSAISISSFNSQPIKQALNFFSVEDVNRITEDMSLLRACECFHLSTVTPFRAHRLPIFSSSSNDDNEYDHVVGSISLKDIMALANSYQSLLSSNAKKRAKELRILKPFVSVTSTTSIGEALLLLPSNRICGIAVLDNETGHLLTTLNCSDLRGLKSINSIQYNQVSIIDFLKEVHGGKLIKPVCFQEHNSTLSELIKKICENDVLNMYYTDETTQLPLARTSIADLCDAILSC